MEYSLLCISNLIDNLPLCLHIWDSKITLEFHELDLLAFNGFLRFEKYQLYELNSTKAKDIFLENFHIEAKRNLTVF